MVSALLMMSCKHNGLPPTEPNLNHPEGCTPIDIELFASAQTRVTVENKNVDYYYLIIDQADESDAGGGTINGVDYDYVVKVKREFMPSYDYDSDEWEAADAYKLPSFDGDWDKWVVYDMIIDGSGKVVEGGVRKVPMYIYGLDREYYVSRAADDILRAQYEQDYKDWQEAVKSDPMLPPPTEPTYATDPSSNSTPPLKYTVVKWDAKDEELFTVDGEGKIVLNPDNITCDLSGISYSEVYANDLLHASGGKEDIYYQYGGYVLRLDPKHQFTRLKFALNFVDNFRNIYCYGSGWSSHKVLTNSNGGAHETVIHTLNITTADNNPIERMVGFNVAKGELATQTAAQISGPWVIDIDNDLLHYYPRYYSSAYEVSAQMLVSPTQITADGSAGDYNINVEIVTKKFEVDMVWMPVKKTECLA